MAMTSDNQTSQPSITAEGTAQIAAPAEARRPEPAALPSDTLGFFKGDELRARVFHDKYALRDPDGRVLEPTPVEMWRRIAGGLASVEPTAEARERYAGEFYWLMENFRFIPGGRIMHAIGNNKRVTALNCFPAGTKVVTRDGILPIELIKPGQEVLTHKNRFRPVTHVLYRDVDEPLRMLKFWYLSDQPIRATGSHPFWAYDGTRVGWVEAKDLTTDHYIKVGRIAETLPSWDLELQNFVSDGIEEMAGMMYKTAAHVAGHGARRVSRSLPIRKAISFDERFGLWLGFFMAEGGVNDNNVYFTFNRNEASYAKTVSSLTRELFGIDASIDWREGQPSNWIRVWIHSKLLVEFVRSWCGGATHVHNKKLPAWFLTAPTSVQKAFVAGLFKGDGVIGRNFIKIFLANPELVRQIFLLLVRLGIAPSIRWEGILKYTRHRGMWINIGTRRYIGAIRAWLNGDYSYDSEFEESHRNYFYKVVDGDLFVKVKRADWTEPRRETVYDLTVDDDHSFVAEFVNVSNCYVLPIKEDSIEAIFEWTKEAARTYSLGGGVGGDISILRPAGAPVNNSARSSTGSVSFMELMSLTTGTIGQSGRRGALMITIADDHPDVLAFTKIKRNMDKVRYANISVRVSDAFMRAVEADQPWTLKFKNERVGVERTVQAREIWRELIYGATHHAEPGIIFWDSIKRWSTSEYNNMNVITTNPCSEIPLEPYGACCLGNLGLQEFVLDEFSPQAQVDWPHLEHALRLATRFLDDVLTYNADKHPLPAQREASLYSRRIGVGFTGLGDMLCKLRLKYDTKEAVEFVDRTFERIKNIVYDESVNLAIEKGTFPGYDREQHLGGAFLQTLAPEVLERIREHGLRNVALLTVPPVGSGAALAGTTSGIEPIFDLGYTRRSESLSQQKFTVYHPLVRSYMERFGVEDEDALPEFFVTAHEIQPDMRVQMQAAIQKHIDHSISSTVNCAADTTEEGVAQIYFLAWKMGCKGITVYRENSRENILTAGVKKDKPAQAASDQAVPAAAEPSAASAVLGVSHGAEESRPQTRARPKVTTGRTERIETPRGRIYVTINEDTKGICEVFVQSLDVEADAVGRLASLALRTGADSRHVIEQLWRVQSREVAIDRSSDGTVVRITTIAQGVALALGRALYGPSFRPDQVFPMADRLPAPAPKNGNGHGNGHGTNGHDQPATAVAAPAPVATETREIQEPLLTFAGVCPDCGGSLAFENGCSHCRSCGYSKC
ncbi:MAG TPA: adenosylcobalamin-dependent ribonucleoside-diphosphate reductase [bacterium]|nr:adenosylcobalamin-dependent ribonucleoside-diphosphate reductase [bacterium]